MPAPRDVKSLNIFHLLVTQILGLKHKQSHKLRSSINKLRWTYIGRGTSLPGRSSKSAASPTRTGRTSSGHFLDSLISGRLWYKKSRSAAIFSLSIICESPASLSIQRHLMCPNHPVSELIVANRLWSVFSAVWDKRFDCLILFTRITQFGSKSSYYQSTGIICLTYKEHTAMPVEKSQNCPEGKHRRIALRNLNVKLIS